MYNTSTKRKMWDMDFTKDKKIILKSNNKSIKTGYWEKVPKLFQWMLSFIAFTWKIYNREG